MLLLQTYLALQAHRKFAKAAESFIGFAASLALVVFRTTKERGFPHLEDIGLVLLVHFLELRLSCYLLWSSSELPVSEVSITGSGVPLPGDLLREVPLETSSLVLCLLFYFLLATLLPLPLGGGMALKRNGL